ncbi:phage protein NinX family protein [Morganella psychrotolerans]|uniref:DUF2591 domain-containing protein n=1 Tax=Morganella psychrotolerans TaxID=368603 RepID=A0A1B8HKW5_9GAMM|nr:phage protein NinX family protein [Morganella psychrotolerans]OBU09884.1 hypothetical protein AYY18_18920 [Morganella psychrotolerans]
MNKYRDKSDFEINKAVAEELIKSSFIIGVKYHDKHILVTDKYANNYPFAPCNNPTDAMPIIIENGISLIKFEHNYLAAAPGLFVEGELGGEIYGLKSKLFSDNRNPYRAAMEVFLMMKEAENES